MMPPSSTSPTRNGRRASARCDRCKGSCAPGQSGAGLLTVESLAELLAIEVSFVRRLVFQNRIPYVKVGRYVRFVPSDVARWIESQKIAGATDRRQRRRGRGA